MRSIVFLFATIILGMGAVHAQSTKLSLGAKCGHNALFGTFAAASVEAEHEVKRHFSIQGGAQYSSIGRVAAEVRPQYFHDLSFGRLSGQAILGYTYQSHMNNFIIGVGAQLDIRHIWARLGYYHRTISVGESSICEPFNIYYELGMRCLAKLQSWDLNIIIGNSRLFELERHYQPSFAVEGWWYPSEKWGVQLGANYKPAGMFNISSDYYQMYGNIGVCYKW